MTNPKRFPPSSVTSLLLCVVVTAVAAAVGGAASAGAPGFYETLVKPLWAPPARIFGPVWTVLYLLMAVAASLVWRKRGLLAAKLPLSLYLVQLGLNALWTWLFFRWRLGGWALAEVILLWVILILTLLSFWRVRRWAGALLLPYLAWVSFAVALTGAIWRLNPAAL